MAESPESALNAKLHDLPIKQSLSDVSCTQMVLTIEDLVISQICSRIESGQKTIPAERRDLAPVIAKLQTKHAADIERMVRLHRLRETQRIKDQLEQKLTHLQDRIEVLNELEESPKTQKASLLKKEVRHQFMEQEHERARETSEFAKKLAEEQRERIRKQRHEARDMQRQAQKEEEKEAELTRKQKEENIAHMKEQEKAKFEQLAQKRKEYMQSLAKLPVRKSPNLQRNASMPELERKKQELAAKRKLENWTDVNKHMQEYDEEKKKREERGALEGFMKSSSSNQPKFEKSKFLEAVKEEERQRKEEEEREQEEFAKRIEMKKRYGEIIKEMYAPVVDPDLRQKLEQDIAKLHTKARVVQSQANSTRGIPSTLNTAISEHRSKKRKDLSKSQPPASEKPLKPVKDYLTEQRHDQDAEAAAIFSRLHHSPRSSLDPSSSDPQSLIVQLAKVDEKTLKKEKLLKRLNVTDPKALAAREDMDSELITSLKTKMALIKNP